MNQLKSKKDNLLRRKNRIRSKIHGSAERPRLSVKISLKNVSAQLINDDLSKTVLVVSTIGNKKLAKMTMSQKAEFVGEEIAKQAKGSKIKVVVLDRNGKIYHGRIKALAEAARKTGLEI